MVKGLMKPPLGQYLLIEPSGRLKVSVGVGRDYGVLIILIAVMAVLHATPNRTVPCAAVSRDSHVHVVVVVICMTPLQARPLPTQAGPSFGLHPASPPCPRLTPRHELIM